MRLHLRKNPSPSGEIHPIRCPTDTSHAAGRLVRRPRALTHRARSFFGTALCRMSQGFLQLLKDALFGDRWTGGHADQQDVTIGDEFTGGLDEFRQGGDRFCHDTQRDEIAAELLIIEWRLRRGGAITGWKEHGGRSGGGEAGR